MITASSTPVFGGVYKLVAVEKDGNLIPKIKVSENVAKITTPGFKQVWRLFDKENDKAIADVVTLHDEIIDETQPYELFDPVHIWKRKVVTDFRAVPLMVQVFDKGKCIYASPSVEEIRTHCQEQMNTMWDEVLRFENPHTYYVDLSQSLWDQKNLLLLQHGYGDH